MDDKRNIVDFSREAASQVDGTVRSRTSRRLVTGIALLLCVGLAVGSLTSCTPTVNRKIGLAAFAKAGASKATLARVDCIMYRESRYQNRASHLNTNGTVDLGLFQINSIHAARWRQVTGHSYWKTWADPLDNTKVAINLWRAAGLSPWRGGCLR